MAGERPFKQQGRIPFTWEIRPGVPKDEPEQQHQRHGSSSDCTSIFDEEQYYCTNKKISYDMVASSSSSSGRFQSDQTQKKPRTRTRSRSLMGIYNFFTARISPFAGEKDKVKTASSPDLENKSPCSTVKKSSSKRSSSSFSSGRWSSSIGSHDVQWSAFGYH